MNELGPILVANRGEIAARVIRTCRRLGLPTVLTVSEADRDSVPAGLADRAVCIGPGRPTESYLRAETVLHAAVATGCRALHPGYGFLSERAVLARLCEDNGIVFVGPTAAQIEAVGDKLKARSAALDAGVPVVPGGAVDTVDAALQLAETIGAPILVKAVGGGGGRGMKRVDDLARLREALGLASAEAGAAFGDSRVYLERYVARGRHVEVQVLGDGNGNVIHLGERDCSVQRRYQKLIEETPAPGLTDPLRADMHEAAVRFARRLRYRGAGTVEFLLDADRGEYYFLEMNARIQVEHPVTESVTGIDLVEEQFAVAAGLGLRIRQTDVRFSGSAIECRINAEDPSRGFAPSPGQVTQARWPDASGVRVDTHIRSGSRVPPFYDSLLAKLIAHGADRDDALRRLDLALAETRVVGVATNVNFHRQVVADPEFRRGGVDTGYLETFLARGEKEHAAHG